MSSFLTLLGKVDLDNSAQLQELEQTGTDMFALLEDHVDSEDNYIFKHLEERAPGSCQPDREEHERLDTLQSELEARFTTLINNKDRDSQYQYYLDFSQFYALYLAHIFHEETEIEPLLHQHFTDEELILHRNEVTAKIPLPLLITWLKNIIAAQSRPENADMLKDMIKSIPIEAMEQIRSLIGGDD